LRKMTPVEYILDPRFEVIGCAVIERNGEYNTAHPSNIYTTKSYWLDADQFQRYVRVRDLSKRVVVCHNALFDASILSWRYGVVPWKIVDTMAMARALVYAFIGKVSLEAVAEHLGLPPKGTTIKNVSGMHADKFAEALRSLGVEPETKTSPATGNQTYAFAKSDPFMIALSEHEDERVQALAAARIGHKSTLEQTRTEKLLRISKLPWYVAGSPSGAHFGRCPIPLRYSGAHTHRLSGDWGLNAQNWPRYTMYDDKPKETGLLRRAHKAPPGFVVVKRDASQIEARVVAWLAGQNDLLLAFADGRDVYCEFGTFASGRTITKADVDDRFVFKSAVLGLGFGVGAPKFVSDVAAKSYVNLGHSIKLDITQGGNIVNAYRQKYSKIPKAWRELQNLIPEMTRPGTRIPWGPVVIEHGAVLLPNGLRLFYHKLHYDTERQEWMFKYGKVPKKLYGGKLFENIVQALARIITMDAARRFEYPLAHQVHDDLVYIVPENVAEQFSGTLGYHMNQPPDWAKGLPLASEGGIGPNYGDAK
jgi:hypothetical protein